jgi:predicted metal-dependent phosphotriesterase family hydrolase
VEEARTLVAAGARSLVDWTPIGLGRDLEGLVRVSEETGLHVVAATGLHRDAHYAGDDPLRRQPATRLAERFVRELTAAPVRCGVVKLGASYHVVTPFEATAFEAGGEAHVRTGAPACVHTEHGTMGLALVERLGALGVPAASVILAHLDRNPDAGEHADTAASGAWLQLDGPGRTKYWPDSTILALIADLAERGFADRLLLGGDTRAPLEHARVRRRPQARLRLCPLQAAARARARARGWPSASSSPTPHARSPSSRARADGTEPAQIRHTRVRTGALPCPHGWVGCGASCGHGRSGRSADRGARGLQRVPDASRTLDQVPQLGERRPARSL